MLKINGLYKNFGALQALDNVDMEVKEGEIHGVIGPNGSGKTTLFNCITGTLKPDGGKVFFKDEEITGLAAHVIANKGIHRTFQAGRLISNLTVLENIMCGVQDSLGKALKDTMVRWPFTPSNREKEIREKAERIAEFIGLADVMNRWSNDLVWTERQLVQIGRALINEPSLLLLDEPASGMGPHEIENMEDIIRKIRGMGITIVVVSHEVKMLMNLSEIVTVLNFGQKIAENVPEIIQKDTRVLEAYLGTE
jgi:ABC-type branched-subunit amino acid transport system ATPase component